MTLYPKITIVTPSFNQGYYLESTMISVLNQDYPNLEYIVMDGGSTDGSVGIIKKYADRLSYWESNQDKGQADAIFRGFDRSKGDVLGWVNSDDLLLPGCLKKVGMYFADHPEKDYVVGGTVIIGADGNALLSKLGYPAGNLGSRMTFNKLLMWGCGCNQPATFWRREAFFSVAGFDQSLRFCFDYDMYFRLAKKHSSGRIKEFLACFRSHPLSKTSTISDIRDEENRLLWERYGRAKYPRFLWFLMNRYYQLIWDIKTIFLQVQFMARLRPRPQA